MSGLLIHSMAEFSDTILACLDAAGARDVAEVGAEFGGMSRLLAERAALVGGTLTSIDPAPKSEFLSWVAENPHIRHIAEPSLSAMPALSQVDAWMIDGDHNYYTVRNELRIADELSQRDGRPLLAFLHDVAWPCARRDMYYAPDAIPAEHRHPHDWDAGITLDDDGARVGRGFRGAGGFAFALKAGGERNGVLTAIEDFLVDVRADGRELAFAYIPAVFGLGVVFAADADWSGALATILSPLHDNALLARVEENRLRNYLAVIELQDREAERVALAA